jgi:hypothetical protein
MGDYDTDIAVLVAEAAKRASERRKLCRVTRGANEEVTQTVSGKWERTVNCDM